MPISLDIQTIEDIKTDLLTVSTQKELSIPSFFLFGLRFHALSIKETISTIDRFIFEKTPKFISFNNAHPVLLCHYDKELRAIFNRSHLSLADGMSIVWSARMLGHRLPERVAGPDLMPALCAHSEKMGHKIFLMGGRWETLNQLSALMKSSWPRLKLVGMYSPPIANRFDEEENRKMINRINAAQPDILFVGLSCPKQERWISENLYRLKVPACLAVGAAFDFMTRRIPRAPKWLRDHGLEWIHRVQEYESSS